MKDSKTFMKLTCIVLCTLPRNNPFFFVLTSYLRGRAPAPRNLEFGRKINKIGSKFVPVRALVFPNDYSLN
jgi:hypothetical protein